MKKKMNFGGLKKQFKDADAKKENYSSMSGSSASNMLFDKDVLGDVKTLKFTNGSSFLVRFVPYEVDETHPLVMEGKLDKGDMAYCLHFDRHVFGEDSKMVVCPRGTYGHKCPICDKSFALRDDDPDAAKELNAKRRVLYNVVVLKEDGKAVKNPNQIHLIHESQYLFERKFQEELSKCCEDEGELTGDEILPLCVGVPTDTPKALLIRCEGEKLKKNFIFAIKKYDVELDEDAILDSVIPLHKMLQGHTYEELSEMLDSAPVTSDEDDDDDDVEERKAVSRASAKKKSAPVEEEEDDDDEDEETDSSEDDEDEGVEADTCPSGYDFGEDWSGYDECENCSVYDECRARRRELRKKNK